MPLIMILLAAQPAEAWWDSGWTLRKQIVIDTSSSGVAISDPIGTTPVLLRLHDGDFRFDAAKADGTDLRFIASDDKTPLAFHVEKFDSVLNEAFVWVSVPGLRGGTKTTFWLYYGNTGNKAVKIESAKDTYDQDTVLVYHFNERGQACFDFTGQGNNSQNPGVPADGSMIGTGLRLDGRTAVTLFASPSLSWHEAGPLTISAWVKFGQPTAQAVFFGRRDGSNLFIVGADMGVPFVALTYGGSIIRSSAGAPVAPGSWHHVAIVASGPRVDLLLDGEPYAVALGPLPALNGSSILGGDPSSIANGISGFVGEIDELEISRVARTQGFIKFAAVEQAGDAGSKLLTLGADEQQTSLFSFLKKGYVGVIIGSLTPDGWAVIGILGVMMLISWLVMIGKALFLSRVGRGNEAFLKEWRKAGKKFGAIDSKNGNGGQNKGSAGEPARGGVGEVPKAQPTVQAKEAAGVAPKYGGTMPAKKAAKPSPKGSVLRYSPLYHIYHLGMEELRARLADKKDTGRANIISHRSIEAIRATLDGGVVRESQRLTSQMVLLTIAISGGPFLGLLGTVVGVMITFAAVAQAGDVNVNAIAPGIAAALAATVAGLAVAIPSLFGYNYLLTRIKGMTSDMHVFVDEFVTKLAEYYQEEEAE
jgi:biopolymer transport protein ExbB